MKYNVLINNMSINMDIEGFYILKSATLKNTANGRPYLSAVLMDKTGTIDMKAWDYSGPIGSSDSGSIILIRGTVSEFKGSLQIVAERLRLANDNDRYDISTLVPSAPIDVAKEYSDLLDIVSSIEDPDYKNICNEMLNRHSDAFKIIPAAKSVHHGFRNGLLMHTVYMLKLADFLSLLYKNVINRSLLLAGTLLHDFAKEKEYELSEFGLATSYSVEGQLLGHLVMGAQEVSDIAQELNVPEKKSVLLQHMILSHHGEPEYGAAVKPICAESELLSYIDMIDSRMEIYRETFETTPPGEFSQRIFALDKIIYHHTDLS